MFDHCCGDTETRQLLVILKGERERGGTDGAGAHQSLGDEQPYISRQQAALKILAVPALLQAFER